MSNASTVQAGISPSSKHRVSIFLPLNKHFSYRHHPVSKWLPQAPPVSEEGTSAYWIGVGRGASNFRALILCEFFGTFFFFFKEKHSQEMKPSKVFNPFSSVSITYKQPLSQGSKCTYKHRTLQKECHKGGA